LENKISTAYSSAEDQILDNKLLGTVCKYVYVYTCTQKGKITDPLTKEVSYVPVIRPGRMQLVKGKITFQPQFPSLKAIGKECEPYDQAHMDLFSLKKEHWSLTIGHGDVRQRHTVRPVPEVIEIDKGRMTLALKSIGLFCRISSLS